MFIKTLFVPVLSALALGTAAQAATFDFESGLPVEISGAASIVSVGGLDGSNGFSGSMLQNTSSGNPAGATSIMLGGLAAHDTVSLSFSLALIDSWDATDGTVAPDFFNILADGVEVFEISVANASGTAGGEVIPSSATGRDNLGNVFGTIWDETTFQVDLSFAHSASALELSLFADGPGWQGGADENWAIDNFRITAFSAPIVPLPAGAVLLLSGLGVLALRRRARKPS